MDVISKYKKQKLITNISVVVTSLALAIWINYVFIWTDIWTNLKTSIVESTSSKIEKADIYLERDNKSVTNIIKIKNSKEIYNPKNIDLSLIYNPENIVIKDISPTEWLELIKISETNWINTISIKSLDNKKIDKTTTLVNIVIEKSDKNKVEHLNIINSFFTDTTNNTYYLNTSGIDF